MIRLGGGGIPCKSDDPGELARAHRDFGYTAAYCPAVSIEDKERIKDIREAFAGEDVVIAEVGAWGNQIPPDPKEREEKFKFVCERLAVAEEVGARCCVDYLGTPVPNSNIAPHLDLVLQAGFDWAVEQVRKVLDEVKPTRTKFTLEMMQWMPPDSPEQYLELIKAVGRPGFAVHLDPVNIIVSPRMYFNTGAVIRRCFELLGEHIVSCHAKDLILRDKLALHLDEVLLGTGNMDYRTYLTELDKLPQQPPLMLEHIKGDEYRVARDHLFALGGELGISFGANGR